MPHRKPIKIVLVNEPPKYRVLDFGYEDKFRSCLKGLPAHPGRRIIALMRLVKTVEWERFAPDSDIWAMVIDPETGSTLAHWAATEGYVPPGFKLWGLVDGFGDTVADVYEAWLKDNRDFQLKRPPKGRN
jgi:hypothetical protein